MKTGVNRNLNTSRPLRFNLPNIWTCFFHLFFFFWINMQLFQIEVNVWIYDRRQTSISEEDKKQNLQRKCYPSCNFIACLSSLDGRQSLGRFHHDHQSYCSKWDLMYIWASAWILMSNGVKSLSVSRKQSTLCQQVSQSGHTQIQKEVFSSFLRLMDYFFFCYVLRFIHMMNTYKK